MYEYEVEIGRIKYSQERESLQFGWLYMGWFHNIFQLYSYTLTLLLLLLHSKILCLPLQHVL